MASWRPVKEPHSIETVAAVVAFSEPLSTTLLKRALRAADRVAASVGLVGREQMATFTFNIGPQAILSQPQESAPSGVQFQRMSITNDDAGNPVNTVALNFIVTPNNLQLLESSYIRWANFETDIRSTMSDVLSQILIGTRVQDVRLEYRDRFFLAGSPDECDPRSLLREGSKWIAPHIFETAGLWHSHTGKLEPCERSAQKLIQIAIDASDGAVIQNGQVVPTRSVSIMTGLQYMGLNGDPDKEQTPEEVMSCFGPLHDESKILFRSLITDDTAIRVGLDGGVDNDAERA